MFSAVGPCPHLISPWPCSSLQVFFAASHMARIFLRNRIVLSLPRCTAAQQQNAAGGSKRDPGFWPQRSHLSALLAKPSSDAELIKILERNLSTAERVGFGPCTVGENTKRFPFEIQDDNGKSIVTLRRRYLGEDIEVTVGTEYSVTRKEHDAMNFAAGGDSDGEGDSDSDDSDDKGDSDDEKCECENCEDEDCACYCHSSGSESDNESCLSRLPLTVRVRKGERSPILEFICTSSPDVVIIEAVYLKHEPSNRGMRVYEGRDFNGLNKDLQKAFYYLDLRGISSWGETSSYEFGFRTYMLEKYCREHRHWLRSMKQFVEK